MGPYIKENPIMKQKVIKPIECNCTPKSLKEGFQDQQLYQTFHNQSDDEKLQVTSWVKDHRNSSFSTSIDGIMAQVSLGSHRVTISEHTNITNICDKRIKISTAVSFGGVKKLARANAHICTDITSLSGGRCSVTLTIKVCNPEHKFTESGLLGSLSSAAKKWIRMVMQHTPLVTTSATDKICVKHPPTRKLIRYCSKEERLALEQKLMDEMGTKFRMKLGKRNRTTNPLRK
tara:strand:+ start:81 stop:776 length:696 start_codon:yes stop_codon:yes gene_type:complete